MKKVGIITIYDLNNYGNRLQNYALYKTIKLLGFSVKTYTFMQLKTTIPKEQFFRWKFHELTGYRFKNNRTEWKIKKGRQFAFKEFTKRFIPTFHDDNIVSINNYADFFVVGSDQVWNPLWFGEREKNWYLLNGIDNNKKKCYAPSFGINKLPDEWTDIFSNSLSTFNCLSVREESGKEIISQLCNKEAIRLIDPTLLLTKKDWAGISKKPCNIDFKKKYILQYFLGSTPKSAIEYSRFLSTEYSYNVYPLLDVNKPDLYACGPREFLYLISNAAIVLTDSFHACVFSFIFDVPFVVYDRCGDAPDMRTRINDFLTQFQLTDRSEHTINKESIFMIDYSVGKKLLDEKKQEAIDFLTKQFN